MSARLPLFVWAICLWGSVQGQAMLCEIFHAKLAAGHTSTDILVESMRIFADTARSDGAIASDQFDRFARDPFSFPTELVTQAEFRKLLSDLKTIFEAQPDRETIRTAVVDALKIYAGAVKATKDTNDAEREIRVRQRTPVLTYLNRNEGEMVGDGSLIRQKFSNDLFDPVTGKHFTLPGWAVTNRWAPTAESPLLLARRAGRWNAYLVDKSQNAGTRLSHSPFPWSFWNLGVIRPSELEWVASRDGRTALVLGKSGAHLDKKIDFPVRASLYDTTTGKRIARVPAFPHAKNGDGRTFTSPDHDVTPLISPDGKQVWFVSDAMEIFTWKVGEPSVRILSPAGERMTHRQLAWSRDGSKILVARRTPSDFWELVSIDPATGATTSTERLRGWPHLSPNGQWLAQSVSDGLHQYVELRRVERVGVAHKVRLPKEVMFIGFTPDSSRVALRDHPQAKQKSWIALYEIENWLEDRNPHLTLPEIGGAP